MSNTANDIVRKRSWSHLKPQDYGALVLFFGLLIWYFYIIRLGISIPDESFYYTITERLAMGDSLFVDDWSVAQLATLFLYLPYRLFVYVTGSTQGLILCMRYLAVAVAMVLYWVVYIKLRKYHIFGIVAAFLLSIYFPANLLQLSYYNIPAFIMTVVCLMLFLEKKALSMRRLILIGLLFSGAVISQPTFVLIFIAFSIFCLVRKFKAQVLEEYDFVLNGKVWRGITIGCLIAFVLVVGAIVIKGGFANIIQTIPELFTDSEYDLSFGSGGHFALAFEKIGMAFEFYGTWFVGGALVICVIAALYRRKFYSRKDWKAILLVASCLLFAAQIIHGFVNAYISLSQNYYIEFINSAFFYSIPGALFGFSCYCLCEKKNPRIFMIWLTSVMMSAIITVSSEVNMCISGPFSNIVPLLCFKALWDEGHNLDYFKSLAKKKSPRVENVQRRVPAVRKSLQIVAAIGVILLTYWGSFDFIALGINPPTEVLMNQFSRDSLTETIDKGPQKGIKTTKEIKQYYDNILADLDEIAAGADGQPVYVAGLWCYDYLYLNLPIGTYSTWFVEADYQSRLQRYWELHPNKRPKYVYIPEYVFGYNYTSNVRGERESDALIGKQTLQFFQGLAACRVTQGRAGSIVAIERWK